ncbi:monocarboxylate transporter 6-like isoform X1 [Brienomyrus brachyistius]|uniref:monocarboxylate transporter 6-like isoform X1 n=1 Tax=Brienomyrus brachyistius TaxID=42636 RepID=UPI0020B29EEA|nr:monocarboxylate transporter 6-like isoform X1 [Brienomyrus brachyistius]XP_048846614.1 monocarboxylate transporter 6-like isoform X1 [Brienomyrus brachyistius]XP_048846615.1 monocarboxylate transporter 6-like isoform X1 [Brienomyrus brachyistius]XP_048846616.1 monocarboxylate transporter 6-like isoform X1 [Brienomyrus brachyistius]XP_048846617.1 monocarboxylate transporter 6-like isoform X1 [Brienomyrus brachyistius]XP_048846618.1 monocarboxylate transporter 6-like isoform X1 [Brienomyrus b
MRQTAEPGGDGMVSITGVSNSCQDPVTWRKHSVTWSAGEDGTGVAKDFDPEDREDDDIGGTLIIPHSATVERGGCSSTQQVAPDGGWGWVVLIATSVVLALTVAFPSCLGIFYTELQTEFEASNTETSWVPSIMTATLHAGGPLCSVLVERYGCRATVMIGGVLSGLGMAASSFTSTLTELYITAGVITGLGFCFCFQPAVTMMGHYFVRRRAFANAMSSTGTAIGLSVLPLLSHFLLSQLDWRGSFLVLGAILLNCCVCGAIMRPVGGGRGVASTRRQQEAKGSTPAARGVLKDFLRKYLAFDLFCSNKRYRAYALCVTWMMLGFLVPLVYLVPYATSQGLGHGQAALLLAILGFVNIFIRPLAGLLFALPWFRDRHVFAYVFAVALLINGLSNCICCLGTSFGTLLAYVLVFGVSISVVGSLIFTVLMDVIEMSRFPAALGLLTMMESATILVGPPLAGLLVDRTGQYTYVFYACAGSVSLSAIYLMVSFYWLDREGDAAVKGRSPPPSNPPAAFPSHCEYSDVPAKGDKGPAAEMHVTSV